MSPFFFFFGFMQVKSGTKEEKWWDVFILVLFGGIKSE